MPKIYISYSRMDVRIAKEVSAVLLQCGYETFLDIDDIYKGGQWVEQLITQIKSAELIVFIVSESSLNSQWCQREIVFARKLGIRILPIAVSRKVLDDADSDFYKSGMSSLRMILWDAEGKRELLRLLRSQIHEPCYCPSDSAQMPNATARPIPSYVDSRSPRAGNWLKKFGIIISLVLLVALIVFYALYRVGSSSYEAQVPIVEEQPYVDEPDSDLIIKDDYGYADSTVEDDPDLVASTIQEGENDDSIAYVAPTVTDIDHETSIDSYGEVDTDFSYEEDTHDGSLWLYSILIVMIGGGAYWLFTKRKFRIKVVSNMDCLMFVDNKEVASLRAKTVKVISLRKGQYYLVFRPLNDEIKERNITISVNRSGELVSMEFQVIPVKDNKTIKCFIAGSTHLEAARNALRAGIAQTHNKWRGRRFEILSYTYEDFEKKAVDGGHQNKYDEFIENEATLTVFIISGEIGQYTVNEFEKAMNAFRQSKHPQILVFNDKNAPSHEHSEELKKKVAANKQYWSDYESLNDLKQQFMYTLDWMLIEMFL